jgi:hypothetical protein
VRAAMIPGNTAARLANRTAPNAIAAMYSMGTFGSGTAEIAWANSFQSHRPMPPESLLGHPSGCCEYCGHWPG